MKKISIILLLLLLPVFIFCSGPGVYWGAFLGDNTTAFAADKYGEIYGKKMAIVMWFIDWNSDFPLPLCSVLYKNGYIPDITWEPWLYSDKNAINLDKIINGKFDEYIKNFARGAKTYGNILFLRVGHEFNGDWYPWCIVNNNNDPEKFKKAWIHIHDIFDSEGATNVRWIWCPNSGTAIKAAWNNPILAYPGDNYADWIGIDGYNFGTYQSWSSWQTFDDIFGPMYALLSVKIKDKPFMIPEFACADRGGDKAAWISSLEAAFKKYPRIKAFVWFDINKEMDWRINSSPGSLSAFKQLISSSYFSGSANGLENIAAEKIVNGSLPRGSAVTPVNKHLIISRPVPDAVIDGKLDEKVNGDPVIIGGSRIYTGYDSQNFYFFADVVSGNSGAINTKKEADMNGGDCVEFALSMDPSADPARRSFGRDDFLIGIKAGDDIGTWNWTLKAPLENPVIFYKKKNNGYILEGHIPLYNFQIGCMCKMKNKPAGFDAAIDFSGRDGKFEKQTIWSGNNTFDKNPSQWGKIIFSTN
jgi:beta-mannanase